MARIVPWLGWRRLQADSDGSPLGFLTGSENPQDVFLEGSPVLFGLPNLDGTVQSDLDGHVAPVPEPASLLLLGTGLLAVAARRRRKSRT